MDRVPRCEHVKVNGTQCGSPALRRRRLCYFHDRTLDKRKKFADTRRLKPQAKFSLGLLEDANAVQVALMHVLQLLGSGKMDPKTAGLMLYGLQTASNNLQSTNFEVEKVTDIVIDRDDVHRTCINGPQWFVKDFDEEEVEAETEEDDADDEQPAAAPPKAVKVESKEVVEKRVPTMEEARAQVKNLVHNWVRETVGEKVGAKPS